MESDREAGETVHVLSCAACPRVSSADARGWKAYRVEEEFLPTVVFYCPACEPDRSERD
jgi:uncharacterized protein YlaI